MDKMNSQMSSQSPERVSSGVNFQYYTQQDYYDLKRICDDKDQKIIDLEAICKSMSMDFEMEHKKANQLLMENKKLKDLKINLCE